MKMSKSQEIKIINILEEYTKFLKCCSYSEPDWKYLKNFEDRKKTILEKYNVQIPEKIMFDNFGKYVLVKFKLLDLLKMYLKHIISIIGEGRKKYVNNPKRKGKYYTIYDGTLLQENSFFKTYPDH